MSSQLHDYIQLENNIQYLINTNKTLTETLVKSNSYRELYFNHWNNTLKILAETQKLLSEKTNRIYELELELMNSDS